jgi:hypothetical protein
MLLAAAIATTKHSIPTRAFSPWPNPSTIILNMSSSSSSTADSSHTQLTQAKHLISKAISIGAPAYNAGNIAECARVYQETAKEIAPLVPSTLQSKLLREVEDGDIHNNPDAKAWALRRVFDSIIEYQPPLVPQATADTNTSYEPFSKTQLPEQPLGVMDNVMGGVSTGSWISQSNTFFGETSLANNGGFASLRWRFPIVQNWSYAKGIYIKGLRHSNPSEHTFRIILKDATCDRVRLSNFKAVFANPEQVEDTPLLIPFSVFDQMEQMGTPMVGSPSFNPSAVTEIGIMAIKPSVVGDFQLEFTEWGLYV